MNPMIALIALICGIGWAANRIIALAAIMYILEKGWPEPTREEWESCIRKTIQNLLSDWFS